MDRFPSNHSFIEGSLIAFAFDLSEADGNEPSADHLLGNIIKDSWARQPQDYRFHPHPDYHQPTRSFSSIWRFGWVLSTSWNWSQFRSNPPLSPPQSIIYANVIALLLQKCEKGTKLGSKYISLKGKRCLSSPKVRKLIISRQYSAFIYPVKKTTTDILKEHRLRGKNKFGTNCIATS